MTNPLHRATRSAQSSRPLKLLARVGYAVNGLIHALIGAIAISVAFGAGGEADQSGALGALAHTPGGVFLLWVVFVGLASLGVWLAVNAFLTLPRDRSKRATHLLSELGKALAYLAVAATTFTFARGGGSSSAQGSRRLSATLLAAPGGVLVVILVGVAVFGIGVYFVVKGLTKRFTRDLTLPPGRAGKVTVAAGVFGYAAKGVVLCAVGVLFCVAAATLDPAKSSGLDGGLKALATLPFGVVILVVVGVGLVAYAVYSGMRARYARL